MKGTYSDIDHWSTVDLIDIGIGYLITRVEVMKQFRGKGHASRLLGKVIEDADREGVTLHLSVEPDGSEESIDEKGLLQWYDKLGFKAVLDPNDHLSLSREPVKQG